jgi:hypothetical protein
MAEYRYLFYAKVNYWKALYPVPPGNPGPRLGGVSRREDLMKQSTQNLDWQVVLAVD